MVHRNRIGRNRSNRGKMLLRHNYVCGPKKKQKKQARYWSVYEWLACVSWVNWKELKREKIKHLKQICVICWNFIPFSIFFSFLNCGPLRHRHKECLDEHKNALRKRKKKERKWCASMTERTWEMESCFFSSVCYYFHYWSAAGISSRSPDLFVFAVEPSKTFCPHTETECICTLAKCFIYFFSTTCELNTFICWI